MFPIDPQQSSNSMFGMYSGISFMCLDGNLAREVLSAISCRSFGGCGRGFKEVQEVREKGCIYMVKSFLQRCYGGVSEWFSVKWLPGFSILYKYISPGRSFGRGMRVTVAVTVGRTSVLAGLWRLGTVFASAEADAETGHKCHRRQARRARQVADGLTFIREIRVFPPLAHTFTKQYDLLTFMREGRGGEASSPDMTGLERMRLER